MQDDPPIQDDLPNEPPVDLIEAAFVEELVAEEVAEALNRWFRWVVGSGEEAPPPVFEAFGIETGNYAWRIDEDVDWEICPHARVVGRSLRISIQTHDTWAALSGLLRSLGALSVTVHREERD